MSWQVLQGDALAVLRTLTSDSMDTCITSPPYWGLRDYGVPGQMGLEASSEAYVEGLVSVCREVRRVLRPHGTLWLNLGDSYAGSWKSQGGQGKTLHLPNRTASEAREKAAAVRRNRSMGDMDQMQGLKNKDLVGIPWRVAFALRSGFSACSSCSIERRSDLWPVHNGHKVCLECLLAGKVDAKVVQTEPGWYLRQEIIWAKPNPMPESVQDRCTKAHEHLFLLAKNERYHFDFKSIREPRTSEAVSDGTGSHGTSAPPKLPSGWDTSAGAGRHGTVHRQGRTSSGNLQRKPRPCAPEEHKGAQAGNVPWADSDGKRTKRSVWTIATQPFKEAHFATFPMKLVEPCILAGSAGGGRVLDPFCGSGTTGCVALLHGRDFTGIELNPEYAAMARKRIGKFDVHGGPLFQELA